MTDRSEQNRVLKQLNRLLAFKKVSETIEGQELIKFIFKESNLDKDPHDVSKNSGQTAHTLGKQSVGRALLMRLIQAGVSVDGNIFTQGKPDKIEQLEIELNKIIEGDNDER